MNGNLMPILRILFILSLVSCTEPNVETVFLLNETFDSNTKGWVEEEAEFHRLVIEDGFYIIEEIDSSSGRTSCYSLDQSHLFNLPKEYTIESNIEILKSNFDSASCGLILESTSFEYEFRFYDTGAIRIQEYNYVTKTYSYYSKIGRLEPEKQIENFDISIEITGWEFDLYVNNEYIGDGKMAAKSWSRVAPFAGKFTSIKVDYLKIATRLPQTSK